MFGIASDNPDIPCPDCRRIMVEVYGFSRALGLDVGIREEYTMPVDYFGRANSGAVLFFFEVLNNLLDGILGFFHKQKKPAASAGSS
ncbi:hypothetical protein [Armatimonas sp.]|uniref:hypothetical protein n=1 Tax=Armatimonas sp. TaxID=1872638 RepID=UPI0037538647